MLFINFLIIFLQDILRYQNVGAQCNTCRAFGNYKCTAPNRYQFCDFQGDLILIMYYIIISFLWFLRLSNDFAVENKCI